MEEGSYLFGPFLFIPRGHLLVRGKERIRLGSRAADILHLLISRTGGLVTKQELIDHTWPSTTVDDANLKVHVSSLRRALGDTKSQTTYIATVPGRGYQFIAPVLMTDAKEPGAVGIVPGESRGQPVASPVFGRSRELGEIAMAVGSCRVVTLAGPVGMGKASVAFAVAETVRPNFEDGTFVVDLSSLEDLGAVANCIAASIGLRATATDMTGLLLDFLEHRRLLIILDHCEKVLPAVRLLVSRFLYSPSASVMMVVSLEPLRVPDESIHRIGSLSYPPAGSELTLTSEEALAFPAVRMLVEGAKAISDYELTQDDVRPVVALCQIMDGRPRSIASALSNLYGRVSVSEMLDIVTRRVLDGPLPNEPDDPMWLMSGKTDFGFSRLSIDESRLFKTLSVFHSGFEVEDVVSLLDPTVWDAHRIFMVLSNLVAKSLVAVESTSTITRYRLLAAERFFGRAQLRGDVTEQKVARAQHARVMLRIFNRAEDEWAWIEPETWRQRYAHRNVDLVEAIDWCAGEGANPALLLELTAAAIRLWDEQGDLRFQQATFERSLRLGSAAMGLEAAKFRVANARAWSLTLSAQLGEATERAWIEVVDLAVATGDELSCFTALAGKCGFHLLKGEIREATLDFDRLEEIGRRPNNHSVIIEVERIRSTIEFTKGRLAEAYGCLRFAETHLGVTSPASCTNRYRWERFINIQANRSFMQFLMDPEGRRPPILDQIEEGMDFLHPVDRGLLFTAAAMPIAYLRQDHLEMTRLAKIALCHRRGRPVELWDLLVDFYSAASRRASDPTGGLNGMMKCFEEMSSRGFLKRSALHLSMIAEAALGSGKRDLACEFIGRAFEEQTLRCEEWIYPELLRVEAKINAAGGIYAGAMDCLQRAEAAASKIGALFFRSRIKQEALRLSSVLSAERLPLPAPENTVRKAGLYLRA
ncbi:ATP-binding protein [Sphingomonas morindae]|uniref:Helix-turn-helix transcriptional regulator n=1 Tax=Sphingomonas morindae TaxID=1541170 RepID=A0ABY4XA93_9SPHN|nr:winged helix-turn-helix domain-containing protein [Sphingomonas morindae]USI73887.1 helix-turn-helix transcriptional regulator [Sphingomonas morindae]